MELRWYQKQAVEAVWHYFRTTQEGAPCVVLPTGSGKTFVISELCRQVVEWGGRALVLAHVKELLTQTSEKLRTFLDAGKIGVYSAGLNERETSTNVVVAGIQSVCDRVEELGEFHLIVVDEAHLIPPNGVGRYRRLLEAEKKISPKARLVGLTATPYRLGCGWIVKDRVEESDDDRYDRILDTIVYEAPIAALINDGTLSRCVGVQAKATPDWSKVHTVRGDFDEGEIEKVLAGKNVLAYACKEIVERTKDRKKVVVFCNRRESARKCAQFLTDFQTEFDAAIVDGETASDDRDQLIRRFKDDSIETNLLGESTKPLKYIVNVGVLTTGFDAPCVDCVALLRPTKSLALYQQMVGRGLRVSENKKDCLVLDFGGNVDRHGPIDLADPETQSGSKRWKTCPECGQVVLTSYPRCPGCGHEFPRPPRAKGPRDANKNVEATASKKAILSDDEPPTVEDFDVEKVSYSEHRRKDATPDDPSTLQVMYKVPGSFRPVCEWLCPEHEGWARKRFEKWWLDKSAVEPPDSALEAAQLASDGALATPVKIRTTRKSGERFPRVEWLEQTEKPDPATLKDSDEAFLDEFSAFEDETEKVENKEVRRCKDCGNWNDYGLDDFGGHCRAQSKEMNGLELACVKDFTERYVEKDCPF